MTHFFHWFFGVLLALLFVLSATAWLRELAEPAPSAGALAGLGLIGWCTGGGLYALLMMA